MRCRLALALQRGVVKRRFIRTSHAAARASAAAARAALDRRSRSRSVCCRVTAVPPRHAGLFHTRALRLSSVDDGCRWGRRSCTPRARSRPAPDTSSCGGGDGLAKARREQRVVLLQVVARPSASAASSWRHHVALSSSTRCPSVPPSCQATSSKRQLRYTPQPRPAPVTCPQAFCSGPRDAKPPALEPAPGGHSGTGDASPIDGS
jgi:hypothetical protein